MKTQSKGDEPADRDEAVRFRNPDDDPRGPYFLTDATTRGDRPAQRFAIRGVLPPAGRAWRFSLDRFAQLEAEGRLVFGLGGRPRLKRYLSEVRDRGASSADMASADPSLPSPTLSVTLIVKRMMTELIRAVASEPDQLAQVEWRDLERVLGEAFEGLGFDTRVTRPARDGGFDIELTCTSNGQPAAAGPGSGRDALS